MHYFATLFLACLALASSEARTVDPQGALCEINRIRRQYSLPPLGWDPNLAAVAQDHSVDQARHHVSTHIGSDGSYPQDRLRKRGLGNLLSFGESVFSISSSDFPDYAESLASDPDLLKDILFEDSKMFGLGVAQDETGKLYYTHKYADFGFPATNIPDCSDQSLEVSEDYLEDEPERHVLARRSPAGDEEGKKDGKKKKKAKGKEAEKKAKGKKSDKAGKGSKKTDKPKAGYKKAEKSKGGYKKPDKKDVKAPAIKASALPKLVNDAVAPAAADAKQPYEKFDPKLLLCLVNKERKSLKLPQLGLNDFVVKAASGHAEYIAKQKKITHFSKDGKTKVGGRIKKAGFKHKGRTLVNENLAYGYADELLLIKALLKHKAARKYMLFPNATMFGAGRFTSDGKLPYYDIIYVVDRSKPTNVPDDKTCDRLIAKASVSAATVILKPGTNPKEALAISGPVNDTEVKAKVDAKLFVCLVNMERSKEKLPLLGIEKKLSSAAQVQANYLARTHKLTNYGEKGDHVGDRADKQSYKWNAVAENIAFGYLNEFKAAQAWLKSPEQLKVLMHPQFTHIGAAKSLTEEKIPYYVMVIGTDGSKPKDVPSTSECEKLLVAAAMEDAQGKGTSGGEPGCEPVKRIDENGYGYNWRYNATGDSQFKIMGRIPPKMFDSLLAAVASKEKKDKLSGAGVSPFKPAPTAAVKGGKGGGYKKGGKEVKAADKKGDKKGAKKGKKGDKKGKKGDKKGKKGDKKGSKADKKGKGEYKKGKKGEKKAKKGDNKA